MDDMMKEAFEEMKEELKDAISEECLNSGTTEHIFEWAWCAGQHHCECDD